MSTPLPKTPADFGFYMPAEWHPHAGTWLTWPKDPETWPDRVERVEEIYLAIIAALAPHETVNVLVDDEATEQTVRRRCSFDAVDNVRFHRILTVDSWIRDYGPNFLISDGGAGAFNDWIFNAWGNKYEALKQDDQVPRLLEPFLQLPRFEPGIVMEGGAIDVNGNGCVLTTEQCLLNPNRNPQLNKQEIEDYLKNYLGVTKVLWLGEGIVGDDTDGHIDDIARLKSLRFRCRALSAAKAPTPAISIDSPRATQTSTSPTLSFCCPSSATQTTLARPTPYNASSPIDA